MVVQSLAWELHMPWVKQKKKKKRKNIIGILIEIVLIYRLLRVVSLSFFFFFFFLSFCLFVFSRATAVAYGDSQARGLIGAAATGLHHSDSNAVSKPRLRPTPQLMAMPDP